MRALRRRASDRRPSRHPRASLSARRGDPVRRLHGDSFRLRRQIANRPEADYIVFCGRALHGRERGRALRAASAGDPSDLAPAARWPTWPRPSSSRRAGKSCTQMGITGVVPVTYINSAASIKAFVGERGGTVARHRTRWRR
jgi:quinolinate synthase